MCVVLPSRPSRDLWFGDFPIPCVEVDRVLLVVIYFHSVPGWVCIVDQWVEVRPPDVFFLSSLVRPCLLIHSVTVYYLLL